MKRADTTHAERVDIVERHRAGETLSAIAMHLDLNRYTVRKWWRAYRDRGWAGLQPKPKGPSKVGPMGRFDPIVKYVALRLKREHPAWGPDMLRLHMSRRPSLQGVRLPKNTALWSYLHQFGARLVQPQRLSTTRPSCPVLRAAEPHQCWQMDFKGDEVVAGCHCAVAPWAVSDEASGAPLACRIHALKRKGNRAGLTVRHVQDDLRHTFARWGLPDALRMDRDPLFVGDTRLQWPGTLLLWLVGLGLQPIINRAYRPTDNAMIERFHRTWKGDVLTGGQFTDLAVLQARSDQALHDRCFHLPSRHRGCRRTPPAIAYPTLTSSRRDYTPATERVLFDLKRVDAYLARWTWRRFIDISGQISLANRNHHVGYRYREQVVKVRFDPDTREFVCTSADGKELKRLVVPEVSQDHILGLGV